MEQEIPTTTEIKLEDGTKRKVQSIEKTFTVRRTNVYDSSSDSSDENGEWSSSDKGKQGTKYESDSEIIDSFEKMSVIKKDNEQQPTHAEYLEKLEAMVLDKNNRDLEGALELASKEYECHDKILCLCLRIAQKEEKKTVLATDSRLAITFVKHLEAVDWKLSGDTINFIRDVIATVNSTPLEKLQAPTLMLDIVCMLAFNRMITKDIDIGDIVYYLLNNTNPKLMYRKAYRLIESNAISCVGNGGHVSRALVMALRTAHMFTDEEDITSCDAIRDIWTSMHPDLHITTVVSDNPKDWLVDELNKIVLGDVRRERYRNIGLYRSTLWVDTMHFKIVKMVSSVALKDVKDTKYVAPRRIKRDYEPLSIKKEKEDVLPESQQPPHKRVNLIISPLTGPTPLGGAMECHAPWSPNHQIVPGLLYSGIETRDSQSKLMCSIATDMVNNIMKESYDLMRLLETMDNHIDGRLFSLKCSVSTSATIIPNKSNHGADRSKDPDNNNKK
jgi:hypothetical protein